MTQRLNRNDWLDFSLDMLTQHGPEVLKANILAKAKCVSRGSFYWHFVDLEDFHAALVSHWVARSIEKATTLAKDGSPEARLASFMSDGSSRWDAVERAMRSWPFARASISALDARRVSYLSQILVESGLSGADAHARAWMLYWANVGRIMCGAGTDAVSGDELTSFNRALLSA